MRSNGNDFINSDISYYGLEQHPNIIDCPYEILKFPQKGLRGKYKKKKTEEAEKAGRRFETKIIQLLKKHFKNNSILIEDAYFLTGNYIPKIHLYASKQIDVLLITPSGIFVIECKYMSDDINELKGRRTSKKWTRHGGSPKYVLNGLRQNDEHGRFIRAILDHSHIRCPLYKITVIGGLSPKKIRVKTDKEDILVHESELVATIKDIMTNPILSMIDPVDPKVVESNLRLYMSNHPHRATLHYIFHSKCVNKKKVALPKTCEGKTEPFRKYLSSFTES